MRWSALFDDMEAQLDAAVAAELDAEVRDRVRSETGRVELASRVRASAGRELLVRLRSGDVLRGPLAASGSDWLLLGPAAREAGQEASPPEVLVPLRAAVLVSGLAEAAPPDPGLPPQPSLATRLDLRSALRGIARDRSSVRLTLDDGTVLAGQLGRVGADHVELREGPRAVTGPVVPFGGLSLVRRSV